MIGVVSAVFSQGARPLLIEQQTSILLLHFWEQFNRWELSLLLPTVFDTMSHFDSVPGTCLSLRTSAYSALTQFARVLAQTQ